MADQTERIIIEIDGSSVKGDAQQVERAINTIGDAADKAGKKVTTAEKGISELGGALKTTGSSAKVTEREFNALQTSIGKTRPTLAQADALKQVANSAKQSASEMANLGRNAGGGVGQIRGITSAATPAASAMSSLSGAAGLLVRTLPMVGAAVGTIKLGSLIQESTMLAARFETLGVAMETVGRNAGYTPGQLAGYENALRKTGISAIEARNNITKMAAANMDLADATKIARIAQDAAVIGNTNSSEAFQRMIYGIQSAQVEVLRTIGLNVNFEQSYKKLADQLGKTSAELTENEKMQARVSTVMEAGSDIAGTYAASMETAGKKLNSTTRLAEDAKVKLGELFQPALVVAVDLFTAALVEANNQLDMLGKVRAASGPADTVAELARRIAAAEKVIEEQIKFQADNAKEGTTRWAQYQSIIDKTRATVVNLRNELTLMGEEERNRAKQDGMIAGQIRKKQDAEEAAEAIRKADEELKKLTATARTNLDGIYKSLNGKVTDQAALDRWYHGELAKLTEQSTKKSATELKKQVSDAKKARAEMLQGGKDAEQAIADWQEKYDKRRVDAIAESTAKTVKMRVDAEKAAADAATAILEKQQAEAEKVMDRIQEGTADVFYDMFQDIGKGWETLWDSMKSWALRTLAELAARAATVQIVVPIMTSMTGTTNATQAVQSLTGGNGGFNLSSLSSLVNPGSMLSNVPGYSTVAGILGTQLPGTTLMSGGALSLAAGGTAGGSVASLAAAQNLAGMTGGLSIGSALGMGGIGGLGYSLLGGSLGLPQNQYSGITSSLGGALGAWGGSALGASSAGAALGATAGSALPVVGTIAGALVGGLASTLFGGDKGSPSIIFNAQTTEWGSTDSTRAGNGGSHRDGFEFHTKSGAKMKHGEPIATALEAVATNAFTTIEATLASFGDGYVDMLDGAVVEFGRKTKGVAGGSWDFDAEDDMDKLLEEYAGKLQDAILQAAAGAFTAAGQDIASGDDAMGALGMLAEANAAQFRSLQDTLAAGVQSGNVEAYIAQLQSFQATVQAITATWDAVNAAADDLVKPPTAYESAVRQANAQFDELVGTLSALGFASAQIEEIEDKRTATLARLNSEMGPLAEAEAARAAALANAERVLETAQGNLRAAYQREAAEIEATARKWDSFAESLKKWRDDIMAGSMSPIPASSQADMAASRYQDVLARAKLGDEDAIAELQGVAGQQLTVAKDTAKTAEDYARSALRTLDEVRSVESVATRHADIARQQLEALTSQVEALITINESVLSVRDAIAQLVAAQAAVQQPASQQPYNVADTPSERRAKVEAQTGVKVSAGDSAMVAAAKVLYQSIHGGASTAEYNRAAAAVGGDIAKALGWDGSREGADELRRVYGFAAGGMHSGGLRLVGEQGPELEVTGPARIWNAEDTKRLLSGGGDGTAEEIRALRDDLRAIGRALAKNTADTAKLMQRWDGDGMPEVRVA